MYPSGSHTVPKDNHLYEVLKLARNATEPEIKRSYRKLAMEFHPDKNPSGAERFKDISFAHEVLTDPIKRSVYDIYGMKGLKDGYRVDNKTKSPPTNPPRTFSSTFSHPFFSAQGHYVFNLFRHVHTFPSSGLGTPLNVFRKAKNKECFVRVTLEELYLGCTKDVEIKVKVTCSVCQGAGFKHARYNCCCSCRGSGNFGRRRCRTCNATGKTIDPSAYCDGCYGNEMRWEGKRHPIVVERGMHSRTRIVVVGEGVKDPRYQEPGDLIVRLEEIPHEVFKRDGIDLLTKRELSLTESLCGFSIALKHLSGTVLWLKSKLGVVTKDGTKMKVSGKGMPLPSNPSITGDLYVEFSVKLPDFFSYTPKKYQILTSVMGRTSTTTTPENFEKVDLVDVDTAAASASTSADGWGKRKKSREEEERRGVFNNVNCGRHKPPPTSSSSSSRKDFGGGCGIGGLPPACHAHVHSQN